MSGSRNSELIGRFLEDAAGSSLAPDVLSGAKRCLLDWMGVAIAGGREPVTISACKYAGFEDTRVPVVGSVADPEPAAFVNGVAAHALDFDDTHIPTDSHISAVTWAALLASAEPGRHEGLDLLRAFAAGYEVAAKLAGRRFGFSLQFRWFHPSAVIGRLASSGAAAVLSGLDGDRAAHAVALSATMASGLRGSIGGMGKPLQVGAAARDGVVCARLAAAGGAVDTDLLSPDGGFIRAFVQDGSAALADLEEGGLGEDWAVLRTSFKPYACLHGIHPSIDAAREIAPAVATDEVTAIRVFVAPGVKKVAQFERPRTPLEAKFSVTFCVAAALSGAAMGADAFSQARLDAPEIVRLLPLVDVVPEAGRKMLDSAVEVDLKDGSMRRGETALSLGHPGNPMSNEALQAKFRGLAEPVYGSVAADILAVLGEFEAPGAYRELRRMLG